MTPSPLPEIAPDAMLTIARMCALFAVTPRTLRFYETKKLLSPVRQGQRRLYTRRCRARLTLILRGKRFGFSLDEIGELLALYDRDDSQITQLTRTYAIATDRLGRMEQQRVELDEAIAELTAEMAWGEAQMARLNTTVTVAA